MLTPSTLRWSAASHDTRPVDNYGAAVTPDQNAKGGWATVMAGGAVLFDVWEIEVRINNLDVTGVARDCLVDVGYDAGAGFQVVIPDLLASYAGPYVGGGQLGITYRFRIHIPAGAAIGARASVNSANLTAFGVSVVVAGDPEDASLHWKGLFVRAIGVDAALSRGTTFSPGAGADGGWVELGTLDAELYDWQLGIGEDDSTIESATYHFDLGIGDADPPTLFPIVNLKQSGTTIEQWSRGIGFPAQAKGLVGKKAFVKGWCSAAVDGLSSAIAYGTGGDGGNTAVGAGGATEPAAATATTATAIRDALAAAVVALAPTSLATHPFKKYDKELPFEEAMQQGPAHCFRVFQCRFDKFSALPMTRNAVNQRWRYNFHIDVAYPRAHYQSADVPVLELDQVEDEDQRLIQDAIWNITNATWIRDGSSFSGETVDDVTYLRFVAQFEFIRAMP